MLRRIAPFLPLALVIVPFLLWPAALGLVASVTSVSPAEVRFVGLENYAALFSDPQVATAFRNVLMFAVVGVGADLVLGVALAYLILLRGGGRPLLRVLLLTPWLVSAAANGVMWHFLLKPQAGILAPLEALGISLDASPLGISQLALPTAIATDVWRTAPLVAFLVIPAFVAIPRERWELATIEGAGAFRRLWHVGIPGIGPVLLTLAMLLFGTSIGATDSLLILTGGGPGSATLTPGLLAYGDALRLSDWGAGATIGWVVAAVVGAAGIVYLILARRWRP
jgi:ABC-type sugar transport system permease subunit